MGSSSSNRTLKWKSMETVAREALVEIDNRRRGVIKPLKTPWNKLNQVSMGGLEWNNIITVAGGSGVGKTAFLNMLETGLYELNPTEQISVLNFNFEMLAYRLIVRKFSGKLDLSTKDLLSAEKPLTNEQYELVKQEAIRIKDNHIFYVDIPGTVEELRNTILQFSLSQGTRGLVVMIDHSLLVKGKQGDKEREVLFDLMAMINELKKQIKACFIILSQLNREIESKDSIMIPELHFPKKSSIFGSESLYQFSDIVLVLHRPEILGIKSYGVNQWPTKDYIYAHFLKVREGEPCVAVLKNELSRNIIRELNAQELIEFKQKVNG